MAAEGVTIRVIDAEVLAALARIDRVADDPSTIMSAIAAYMVTATQRHIETERGPEGKWPALSPRTAAKRIGRRRRGTANMLRVSASSGLYATITGDSGVDFAAVGSNKVYAAIHQFGGKIDMPARQQEVHLARTKGRTRFVKASAKRKETRRVQVGAHSITIPARPYLYLDDTDRAEILEIAAEGFRTEAGLS